MKWNNNNNQNDISTTQPHRLGDLLLRQELIDQQQLQQALACQRRHGQRLGEVLIELGFISDKTLKQVLRKQRWLRPCAACFAVIAPFSACFASEDSRADAYSSWGQQTHLNWSAQDGINATSSSVDMMKIAAETAWDIYQGEPEKYEWRYSLSKPQDSSGYHIEMTMHF